MVSGLARSGTTWLAKLLDSHPMTMYKHEPDRPPVFPDMPHLLTTELNRYFEPQVMKFMHGLEQQNRVNVAGTLPVFRKAGDGYLKYQARSVLTQFIQLASRKFGNIQMPELFQPTSTPVTKLVWKSVLSSGRLDVILNSVPNFPIIYIIRHPCGVISSRQRGVSLQKMAPIANTEFTALMNHSSQYLQPLLNTINPQDTIELEAFRWALLNSSALQALKDKSDCMIIRYEDLCESPVNVIRKVLDTVGLPWHEQVAQFIKKSTASTSSRFYGVSRKTENVDSWKQNTSIDIQHKIQRIVCQSPAGKYYPS